MSLTSYRAAPPRAGAACVGRRERPLRAAGRRDRGTLGAPRCSVDGVKRVLSVLGRSGDDLLSRVLRHSTIGAEAFNGRVRDGIGFLAPRSNHRTGQGQAASKRSSGPLGGFPTRVLSGDLVRTRTMRAIKPF